ncbi:chemotaxis protein CheA [Geobacter sp. AOG2]|uniref:chemotaxis protein CheA n=1 Tax=Geobacter sp. AOG2 TaxID=1566347 RepID=UPI001CC6CB8D|nr:chemotaxis protein CheA [Geobacter sp. AOG2]GFE61274.1 chemotaxis protein CheA [Geobacter sp. AOG2]
MTDNNPLTNKAVRDFLAEAEEIVEHLGSELADLADLADGGDIDPDLLNSIFRGAHSLKGLAGMFGFSGISELSHNLENLLDWLRLGKLKLDAGVIAILLESHDVLFSLVRGLSEGKGGELDENIQACAARINACLEEPSPGAEHASPLNTLGLSEQVLKSLTEYEEHRLLENLSKGKNIYSVHASLDLATFDLELAKISDAIKTCGEIISTLPSMSSNLDSNIDFDILAGSSLGFDEFSQATRHDNVTLTLLSGGRQPAAAPEAAASGGARPVPESPQEEERSAAPAAQAPVPDNHGAGAAPLSAKSISRTVRVDIGKLDELMNIVGELVLAHSSIATLAERLRSERFSQMAVELGKSAKVLERKLTDLQKGVMDIRMIPVGQLYEKMSRIVRTISREQNKKVELLFYGADTELDKLIVEDISDPMMHIIRNAIDHGIESPEKRLAAGKDEKGVIKISSYQKGNHVVIEVEDDGGGIDIGKVKARALQRGFVQDPDAVSDKEALEFIFLPGFSTTDQVSEVSGRGVGMDVVRNNIAAISGMVDIETTQGSGTRFIITLPITLAIIKSLIISCADRTYALPVTSVLESLILTGNDIKTVERREVTQLRDSTLPLIRLEEFLCLSRRSERPDEFYVVVVGVAEKRLGIIVDALLGQQDIVIKSLGEGFRRFPGIAGAADLGDQRTILVLDVGGMINDTMRSGS